MMILMTILWFYSHVTVSLALALIGGLPRPGPTWHSNFAASTSVAFDTCTYSHCIQQSLDELADNGMYMSQSIAIFFTSNRSS